MKLSELDPQFLKLLPNKNMKNVDTVAEADGIMYLCPACFAKNNGPVGTHRILNWFRDKGVPADATPGPGRWVASGSNYGNLTLTGSVKVDCWHGFITNGDVRTV